MQYIRIKIKWIKISLKRFLAKLNTLIKYTKQKKKKRKIVNKRLKKTLYREIQKRKQNKVNNELNKLRFHNLVNNNITESDIVNIKQLNAYPIKTLQSIAKLRNINSNMSKKDTIYALVRSEPAIKEKKCISYLSKDTNNDIHNEINKIRM